MPEKSATDCIEAVTGPSFIKDCEAKRPRLEAM
jgi:hypothetical protein